MGDEFFDLKIKNFYYFCFRAPLTSEQVDLVVTSIDTDEDGTINYEEFLESFVVVDILTSGRGNSNDGQLSRSSSSDTTITCEAVLGMVRSHASSIDESDSDTIKEQLDKHDSIDSIDSIESVDREMDINEGETVSNIPEVRQTHPGHTSENGLRVFEFECHTIPEDGYEQSPRLE